MTQEISVGAFGEGKNSVGIIEKVIRPEEGGIYVKYVGCSYLSKGHTSKNVNEKLRIPKNAFRQFYKLSHSKIFILFFFLPDFITMGGRLKICEFFVAVAHPAFTSDYPWIKDDYLQPKRYCIAVREFYRTLNVMIDKIKNKRWKIVAEKARDIFCMFLEHDTAYKFRFQDILPEIDVERLKKDPVKELRHVCSIFFERESKVMVDSRWKKIMDPLLLFLRFGRRTRNVLVKLLSEIDYGKIKLDESDWYYCLDRYSYKFGGMSHKDRFKEKEKIDAEKGHAIPYVDHFQLQED